VCSRTEFGITYADNTKLKGFEGVDVVQLGAYYVYTRFHAITQCDSADFNNISGILGLGLPTIQSAVNLPSIPSKAVPPPLLFDLTDSRIKDNDMNRMLPRRAFSFLSTPHGAELQLGGYDPASVVGELFVTPSIQMTEYMVPVLSIKYGEDELLLFSEEDEMVQAVLDSGTSCLVLPDASGGLLQEKPYSKWLKLIGNRHAPTSKKSFYVNIAGREFEIPYSTWFGQTGPHSGSACVQRMPPAKGTPVILLGDVLFRNYVVMFDISNYGKGPIMLGIGKQNPDYQLASKSETITKLAVSRLAVTGVHADGYVPPQASDTLPVYGHYYVDIEIGSPRQKVKVLLDTGSSEFGVFSQCPKDVKGLRCDFGHVPEAGRRRLLASGPVNHATAPVATITGSMLVLAVCLFLTLANGGLH